MQKWIDKAKEYKWQLLAGVSLLLVAGIFVHDQRPQKTDVTLPIVSQERESSVPVSSSSSLTSGVLVDVKGAVNNPGVYRLGGDARVQDAIQKAGGLSVDADPTSVNLAQKLADESVVHVARQGEEGVTINSGDQSGGTTSQTNKININRASASELTAIPGIGEKKAQEIVAYREANGPFKSIDDLSNVSGIGPKTVEKIKDVVCLS